MTKKPHKKPVEAAQLSDEDAQLLAETIFNLEQRFDRAVDLLRRVANANHPHQQPIREIEEFLNDL